MSQALRLITPKDIHTLCLFVRLIGHGFKMAPVVGKVLAQLSLGQAPSYDLTPFRIRRFPGVKSHLWKQTRFVPNRLGLLYTTRYPKQAPTILTAVSVGGFEFGDIIVVPKDSLLCSVWSEDSGFQNEWKISDMGADGSASDTAFMQSVAKPGAHGVILRVCI